MPQTAQNDYAELLCLLGFFVAIPTYSYRNATSGSTFVARRAGIEHASSAAPNASRNADK
jgi:hypothetical protein